MVGWDWDWDWDLGFWDWDIGIGMGWEKKTKTVYAGDDGEVIMHDRMMSCNYVTN